MPHSTVGVIRPGPKGQTATWQLAGDTRQSHSYNILYRSLRIIDLPAPSHQVATGLHGVVFAEMTGDIGVHCALGFGRSVALCGGFEATQDGGSGSDFQSTEL